MKIIEIERTVSGNNFDNISLRAQISESESVEEVAKMIDLKAKELLGLISAQETAVREARQEKAETVSFLKRALEYAENNEIPF